MLLCRHPDKKKFMSEYKEILSRVNPNIANHVGASHEVLTDQCERFKDEMLALLAKYNSKVSQSRDSQHLTEVTRGAEAYLSQQVPHH